MPSVPGQKGFFHMPWEVRVLEDAPVLETIFSGVLSPAELSDAVRETFRLAQLHDRWLILGNCIGLGTGHSLFDLYGLVDFLEASGLQHKIREAVLLPDLGEPAENVRFWETACLNRGIRVQIFQEHQAALDWLLHQ